jgi:hypothetical protein
MGSKSGIDGVLDVAVVSGGAGGSSGTTYATPDGRQVAEITNAVILFSDDFGGTTLNSATGWDVLDGGLQANQALPSSGKSLAQGAIGTGTNMGNGANSSANTALTVSSSNLAIAMGTTNGAELWALSQQAFAGTEDLFFTFSKSQSLAANSIQVGLVEVDPTTLVPILNPNLAHAFTNAGLCELGTTTVATTYSTTAIGDSSGAFAAGGAGTTLATMVNTPSEFLMEFHAEDLIVSNGAIDSAAARNATVSRVSSQVPNDGKVYKLLVRLRNTAAPASSTTATFGRVMLWNSQELRVEVASGRGDQNPQKAVAVNVAGQVILGANGAAPSIGAVFLSPRTASGGASAKTISTGATGQIFAAATALYGYDLYNSNAAVRYLQFYNSNSTTFGSQGAPFATIPILAGAKAQLFGDMGMGGCSTGLSYAITTDAAGATEGASGDIVGTVWF